MSLQNPELGKYIVIEGSDGSGKSTQRDRAHNYLSGMGLSTIHTIEPGGTCIGETLREVLKQSAITRHPLTDVDLFTASRRESALRVIRPAVAADKIVLADRSYLSTIAYQGFGDGVDLEYILNRSKDALEELMTPDLTIILLVPFELLWERLLQRGGAHTDYFESKGPDFLRRVVDGYEWISQNLPVHSVDGSEGLEQVWQSVKSLIDRKLRAHHGV